MIKVNLVTFLVFILAIANCQIIPKKKEIKSISIIVDSLFKAEGMNKAIETYQKLYQPKFDKLDFNLDQLNDYGFELLKKKKATEGLKILQLNCALFPNSAKVYSSLGQAYYYANKLKNSKEAYIKFLDIEEPLKLMDVILIKRLFFVPDSFEVPEKLQQDEFIIKPIKAIHAELDYQAIMSSIEHLTGVLGRRDWPGDLTLEEDRKVLKLHEWEFEHRVGFVYTVMNISETEVIGCIYIYPSRLDNYKAEIGMWVTEKEFNKGADEILFTALNNWISSSWPFENVIFPGRELSWGEFFEKLDQQDTKYTQ